MTKNEITYMLNELGFVKNCIVETVFVSSGANGVMNAAPMGIKRLSGNLLEVMPFLSSKTYRNLCLGGKSSINLTNSPRLFLATAFKDEVENQPKIDKEMVIENADATIMVEVIHEPIYSDLRACFNVNPIDIRVFKRLPMVFSRGRSAAIEAVIHATRIQVFKGEGMAVEAEKYEEMFQASANTVFKVSSKDSEETCVIDLLRSMMKDWSVRL